MYVFIAIIFIAELIIAGFLIYWIVRADKAVNNLDKKFAAVTPEIIATVRKVRDSVKQIQIAITKVTEVIKRKRQEFWQKVINIIIIYTLLLVLKVKFKKAATLCQYAVFIKDCWDSIPG